MFHAASPASSSPALRPTRGSGLGPRRRLPPAMEPGRRREAGCSAGRQRQSPTMSESDSSGAAAVATAGRQAWSTGAMSDSSEGTEWVCIGCTATERNDHGRAYARAQATSIRCMRAISVVWSALTSEANLKTVSSCPAPWTRRGPSPSTMAPRWCWIMKVRKSRSKSVPRACVELLHLRVGEHAGHQHLMLHAVHHHLHRRWDLASGTGWLRSRSQCCIRRSRPAAR